MIILALEASTTSAKSMLFNTANQEVTVASRRFDVDDASAHSDAAVRSAEGIHDQVIRVGREAAAGVPVDMVVLSGTWHGVTLLNEDLSEVSPVQEWPYTGAQNLCAELREDANFTTWFYRRTGCMVNAIYPAFKLMQLQREGVEIRSALLMDQSSYIFRRLTGQHWMSLSSASGTGLLNTEQDAWDHEVLQRLGIDGVVLPELTSSTATAELTTEASRDLGIAAGIPVVIPGPDGGLNQVGAEATAPGDMTFSMGTSGALRFAVPEPSFSPRLSTWSYRSPVGWLSGAAASGCTNCVDWAKGRLFDPQVTYADLEPQLRDGPVDLPLFMPFLFGERCPGWQDQRRGGFLQLLPSHSRADMYQSVLQGVTMSLLHCYQELTILNGVPRRIILSGGVLSSPFWTQLTADVFGVEMELSTMQDSSVVGAMRMALTAAGEDPDQPAFRDDNRRIVTPRTQFAQYHAEQFGRYLEGYQRTDPASTLEGDMP